jgi:hypothetical protein
VKLDALVNWYENLTPETVASLGEIYHEDARFRDPFNEVRGHAAIARIFQHMFMTTKDPAFRISDTQKEGDTAWVSWTFDFGLHDKILSIDGATRLIFGDDGRVIDHRDFWDASDLFESFPLLGTLLRLVKRRLNASNSLIKK